MTARPDNTMIAAWIGNKLEPVDKLDVHRRGLKHPAVSVFVMHGDQLLLQRRALSKYHTPGLWANTCCTHPHWGEPSRACAIRRLDEELGLRGLSPELRETVEYRADVGASLVEHEVVDVYLADAAEAPTPEPNPAEVMDWRWLGLEDLKAEIARTPEIFAPWLRIYLDRHGQAIFGH